MKQNEKTDQLLVIVLAGIAAISWGLVFLVIDILLDHLEPVQILAARWLVAAIGMIVMVVFGMFKLEVTRKNIVFLLVIGLLQAVIYPLSETFGIMLTSASIISVFESLIPCFSVIWGALVFGKKTNRMGVASIIIVITGVVMCTVLASDFSAEGKILGYFIALAGIVATALYGQMAAKAGETVNAWSITFVMCMVGAIVHTGENFLMGYGMDTYTTLISDWRVLLAVLFLGVGSNILCFSAYNKAMALARNPGLAANFNGGLVTVTGVCAGVFIRHDVAGWYTIAGIIIILIGVWLSGKQV